MALVRAVQRSAVALRSVLATPAGDGGDASRTSRPATAPMPRQTRPAVAIRVWSRARQPVRWSARRGRQAAAGPRPAVRQAPARQVVPRHHRRATSMAQAGTQRLRRTVPSGAQLGRFAASALAGWPMVRTAVAGPARRRVAGREMASDSAAGAGFAAVAARSAHRAVRPRWLLEGRAQAQGSLPAGRWPVQWRLPSDRRAKAAALSNERSELGS